MLILLSACSTNKEYNTSTITYSLSSLMHNLPDGGDRFSRGFRAGCYDQIGYQQASFYKEQDGINDHDRLDESFYQAFEHGRRYCNTYKKNTSIM